MNRAEKRKYEAETRALFHKIREDHHTKRKSGKWPPWNCSAVAAGEIGGHGWTNDINCAYENGVYAVLVRSVVTEWGMVDHACISTLTGGDIAWRDKQRIKDELFGMERTAIEVFPARDELVDGADSFHLWVLPETFALPFSIGRNPS